MSFFVSLNGSTSTARSLVIHTGWWQPGRAAVPLHLLCSPGDRWETRPRAALPMPRCWVRRGQGCPELSHSCPAP